MATELSEWCQKLLDKGLLEIRDEERSISCWQGFMDFRSKVLKDDKKWAFRGMTNWEWDLKTSLERMADNYMIPLPNLYEEKIEQGLIRRFKREYPKYSWHVPDDLDHISWLAIMQHHGAPTRLLDITFSAYIALYFALQEHEIGSEAAIWCMDREWLDVGWDSLAPRGFHREYHRDRDGTFIKLFDIVLRDTRAKVYVLNPFQLPERLSLQQGGFVVPIDVTKPFMENLLAMPTDPVYKGRRVPSGPRIIKVRIAFRKDGEGKRAYTDVMNQLLRMNINRASLFPGLDGYAASLKERMLFPEQIGAYKKGY